ncbi:MAG: hypothetical protein JXD23_13045 [Spirochaetales bacterium]|nr:hypothetical protein [Spirochaetales bacterium]
MRVYVCSDDPRVRRVFSRAAASKKITIEFLSAADAFAAAKRADAPSLCYVDAASLTKRRLATLQAARSGGRPGFGIVDPAGSITDPAQILREGAADYLGPKLCRAGVTAARLEAALGAAAPKAAARPKKECGEPVRARPSRDWKSVQPGCEYLFHMLYVELDGLKDTGLRSAESTVGRLIAYFQAAVERAVAAERGRLWIWTDFAGIVLFPSAVSVDAVTAACLRFMLSRRMVSMDQSIQKLLFSYRLVLMEGTTVYRERGRTGTIISDSVNSLSHIGAKYAKPGNFYLAETFTYRIAPGFRKCFGPAGAYEGTKLVKMKLPARY